MMKLQNWVSGLGFAVAASLASSAALALTPGEVDKMVKTIDERQRNFGDFQGIAFIEQKEKGKSDKVFELSVYRRDSSDKMILLFLKPTTEAGKGYLKIESNLFFYDPKVGKWERRTERERIGGTAASRSDFDASRYSQDYKAEFQKMEKLGKFDAALVKLTAKPDLDVSAAVIHLWIDTESGNMLKEQRFSASGKLLRTAFYPKWNKTFSSSKKSDVFFPQEVRIFDEVEKGNQTLVVMRQVKLDPLDENLFTKAWMESKSR
jgi:hypothetical protein